MADTSDGTAAQPAVDWVPEYDEWRHGGWYVSNVRYPSGAVGCVSRNFADKKWRIVDETSVSDLAAVRTFPNRDAAARAELERANAMWVELRRHVAYPKYREVASELSDVLCDYMSRYAHTDVVLRVACSDELVTRRIRAEVAAAAGPAESPWIRITAQLLVRSEDAFMAVADVEAALTEGHPRTQVDLGRSTITADDDRRRKPHEH